MNSQMVKSLSLNIPYLRHLDTDLSTILKAAEPFEWDRVNFVLEASWTLEYFFLNWLSLDVLVIF